MTHIKPLTTYERKLFDLICKLTEENVRCPVDAALEERIGKAVTLPTLANKGWVEIRVFPGNWRVVLILVGEYASKHTLFPPEADMHTKAGRTINIKGDTAQNASSYRAQPVADVSLGEKPPWEK